QHVLGDHAGYAVLFTGRWAGKGLDEVRQEFYHYPDELEAMLMSAFQHDDDGREVYFATTLFDAKERRKRNIPTVPTLWVDADGAKALPGLRPTAIVASSHDRDHLYYRLRAATMPLQAERLNRGLAEAMGADVSGHDLTQVLRLPG